MRPSFGAAFFTSGILCSRSYTNAVAIKFHPKRGTLVVVDYASGFKEPEMVGKRLAVVISPDIKNRPGLLTVVPLSLTAPKQVMPYHAEIDIPFDLPKSWGNRPRWVKGDMVNTVGFHRADLVRVGKSKAGKRQYLLKPLPDDILRVVQKCALHGQGFSTLTKHL